MALKYKVGIRRGIVISGCHQAGYSHASWAGGALKSWSTALLEMASQRKKLVVVTP